MALERITTALNVIPEEKSSSANQPEDDERGLWREVIMAPLEDI
jgi:hypothetical protein